MNPSFITLSYTIVPVSTDTVNDGMYLVCISHEIA